MKNCDRDDNLGYFKLYPAPMFEALCRLNPSELIGCTTTMYGPMLYCIVRALTSHNCLEIGNDFGWSSGFMAWAIKENNARFGSNGKFYGVDIGDKSHLQKAHDEAGLPSQFIHDPKGSVHWLMNQNIFGPESLDVAFIDGLHEDNYLRREIELVYPLIKGKGAGYICLHDVYSSMQKTYPKIISDPRWKFEAIRFPMNYGFAILRKMEGYEEVDQWPEGDEKGIAIEQGVLDKDHNLINEGAGI